MSTAPFENGFNEPETSAHRRWTPGKIAAVGCGVPVAGLLLLALIGTVAGDGTGAETVTATPAQLAPYAGKWRGRDGTSIWIRGDGRGDFNFGSTKVEGGGVTLDVDAKTLRISGLFGIGKTWAVTVPPHSVGKYTEMTLDKTDYRRRDDFAEEPTRAAETSGSSAGGDTTISGTSGGL